MTGIQKLVLCGSAAAIALMGTASAEPRAYSQGREVRTFDGMHNNLDTPSVGATFQQFQRLTSPDYADGISKMAGPLRASPRVISNAVIAQGDRSTPNDFGTSDFIWQWGQFIDHDITLGEGVPGDGPDARDFDIPVPLGDRFFDPFHEGDKIIHFDRALFDPLTGTNLKNPREQMNQLTSWIDGSMVYGSDADRAYALRTNDGKGRLKTSRRNLLPFNTDGLHNDNGPAGADPASLFVAGDIRVNEQVGLTTMHTLFVREHNRWADIIRRENRHYSGDDIFQAARRMVIAEIQIITYNEFLPALIGPDAIPAYNGYTPGDPTISTEFSGAAYRFGHSAINTKLMRLDRRGREINDGHLTLRNAFFNAPDIIKSPRDIDPILRGLASQRSQRIDAMIIDDLRNFLFGPPGAGGFDLASLNMQRGRDRGIASYNDVREQLGLGRASDFDEVTSDFATQQALASAYASVDDIDIWVGGLAEDAVADEGSQLGPLFREILVRQFAALRDNDRFWHQRDLTASEYARVKNTTLADIIRANTRVRGDEIPDNVFFVRD